MCGIAGFVSETKNEKLINQLTEKLMHRGPDELNIEIIKKDNLYYHFGSARLSIVGLVDGKMPMVDIDKNCLVYNGELYQLEKIRKNFSDTLNTTSDTRHLFKLLNQNSGNIDVNDLNGMFAFAYFNSSKGNLTLGRDELGIKPLYYLQTKEIPFLFCSEVKPIIEAGITNNKMSKKILESYILFGGFNSDTNIIDQIKTLKPGSLLKWSNNNLEISNPTNDNFKNYENRSFKKDNFLTVLDEVINDQITADVPVNILLSGGIDSSIIAWSAKKFISGDIKGFSLYFENDKFNEISAAEELSKTLKIPLVKFLFESNSNEQIIDELLNKLPEPIADPSIIPTYFLTKKVSEYTKAVISGDGADELFGGYEWYRAIRISKIINESFNPLIKLFIPIIDKLNKNDYIKPSEKFLIFNFVKNVPPQMKTLFWQNFQLSYSAEKQIEKYTEYLNSLSYSGKLDLNYYRYIDIKTYLYTNILKKGDIASMLNSLEVRPVFLDKRLVNYANSFNVEKEVNFSSAKNGLRSIVSDFNANISKRPKHGFAHDFSNWANTTGLNYLKSLENDFEEINTFLKKYEMLKSSSYIGSREIWKLYSIFRWSELNKIEIID